MMTGTVTANREIVIPLEVIASGEAPTVLQVIVDTGFNGYVTLPSKVMSLLWGSRVTFDAQSSGVVTIDLIP